jgi:predicted transcriptional regulator YdeE
MPRCVLTPLRGIGYPRDTRTRERSRKMSEQKIPAERYIVVTEGESFRVKDTVGELVTKLYGSEEVAKKWAKYFNSSKTYNH